MKNQTISEFPDDKKIKYSSNSNDILKTAKTFYEKLYTKRQPSKLLRKTLYQETTFKTATNQIPSKKKISMEHFHLSG